MKINKILVIFLYIVLAVGYLVMMTISINDKDWFNVLFLVGMFILFLSTFPQFRKFIKGIED